MTVYINPFSLEKKLKPRDVERPKKGNKLLRMNWGLNLDSLRLGPLCFPSDLEAALGESSGGDGKGI